MLYVLSCLESVCLSWTGEMSKCPPVLHCQCHVICSVMSWKCCLSVMNRQNVKMPTSFTLSVSCHMFCHVLKVLFVCREQAKCQNGHQFYTVILCVLPCLDGNIYVCLLRIVEIFWVIFFGSLFLSALSPLFLLLLLSLSLFFFFFFFFSLSLSWHSCLNLYPCVIKFSQSVSLCLCLSLSLSVSLSPFLFQAVFLLGLPWLCRRNVLCDLTPSFSFLCCILISVCRGWGWEGGREEKGYFGCTCDSFGFVFCVSTPTDHIAQSGSTLLVCLAACLKDCGRRKGAQKEGRVDLQGWRRGLRPPLLPPPPPHTPTVNFVRDSHRRHLRRRTRILPTGQKTRGEKWNMIFILDFPVPKPCVHYMQAARGRCLTGQKEAVWDGEGVMGHKKLRAIEGNFVGRKEHSWLLPQWPQ